jgi:hypothetical protein
LRISMTTVLCAAQQFLKNVVDALSGVFSMLTVELDFYVLKVARRVSIRYFRCAAMSCSIVTPGGMSA